MLCEQAHIQFSEIGQLPYYEYEMTLELYDEILKEREEARQKQEDERGDSMSVKGYERQAQTLMRNAKEAVKMPSMPNISLPNLS